LAAGNSRELELKLALGVLERVCWIGGEVGTNQFCNSRIEYLSYRHVSRAAVVGHGCNVGRHVAQGGSAHVEAAAVCVDGGLVISCTWTGGNKGEVVPRRYAGSMLKRSPFVFAGGRSVERTWGNEEREERDEDSCQGEHVYEWLRLESECLA